VDGKNGAEELIAKVIRDDALLKWLATIRLPCRFTCYYQVEGLAVSLRLVPKLRSRTQLAHPGTD
jgi:hypothetical protein